MAPSRIPLQADGNRRVSSPVEEAYETARQASHDQLRKEKPELYERLMRAKDERLITQRCKSALWRITISMKS